MTTTSTTTETTAPDPDLDSPMASVPTWGRKTRLPSWDNPDPAPTGESTRTTDPGGGAADSASSAQDAASIRALFKGRAKSYAKVAETFFKAVGGLLNNTAAAAAGETDAWLPDEDDLETVPPPLGRIAARRIKIGANPDQLSDLEDIGMVAVGLLIWAAKGASALFEARRARRRLEDGRAVYNETGDGR